MWLPSLKRRCANSPPRDRLGLEIALMLVIKIALIYALWLAFFSEPVLRKMTEGLDPQRVAAAVVSSHAVPNGLTFAPPTPALESQP